jgi:hypothetical protein
VTQLDLARRVEFSEPDELKMRSGDVGDVTKRSGFFGRLAI